MKAWWIYPIVNLLCFWNGKIIDAAREGQQTTKLVRELCLHLPSALTVWRVVTVQTRWSRGAAVAQWIRSRLPSCRPGFESQAHHLRFYQFKFKLYHVEKTKINAKRGRDWPVFFNKMVTATEGLTGGILQSFKSVEEERRPCWKSTYFILYFFSLKQK